MRKGKLKFLGFFKVFGLWAFFRKCEYRTSHWTLMSLRPVLWGLQSVLVLSHVYSVSDTWWRSWVWGDPRGAAGGFLSLMKEAGEGTRPRGDCWGTVSVSYEGAGRGDPGGLLGAQFLSLMKGPGEGKAKRLKRVVRTRLVYLQNKQISRDSGRSY